MASDLEQRQQWLQLQQRLQDKQLLSTDDASLSLRIPGTDKMWFGTVADAIPRQIVQGRATNTKSAAMTHAAIYGARSDVGAIAVGGGSYGRCLADFGGTMPQAFDEQARHLGAMAQPITDLRSISLSLRRGGNVLQVAQGVACLGMTATRLALNAELFEKCAKAYVLAVASGGRVRPLPWLVRFVANRRLHKDEQRASHRFSRGLLPEETKGY